MVFNIVVSCILTFVLAFIGLVLWHGTRQYRAWAWLNAQLKAHCWECGCWCTDQVCKACIQKMDREAQEAEWDSIMHGGCTCKTGQDNFEVCDFCLYTSVKGEEHV